MLAGTPKRTEAPDDTTPTRQLPSTDPNNNSRGGGRGGNGRYVEFGGTERTESVPRPKSGESGSPTFWQWKRRRTSHRPPHQPGPQQQTSPPFPGDGCCTKNEGKRSSVASKLPILDMVRLPVAVARRACRARHGSVDSTATGRTIVFRTSKSQAIVFRTSKSQASCLDITGHVTGKAGAEAHPVF